MLITLELRLITRHRLPVSSRNRFGQDDPENAWPRTIVYRNLRHHAATKWFYEELEESWEVVAQYLGDKLTTVLNHYVRVGEDSLHDSVRKLDRCRGVGFRCRPRR